MTSAIKVNTVMVRAARPTAATVQVPRAVRVRAGAAGGPGEDGEDGGGQGDGGGVSGGEDEGTQLRRSVDFPIGAPQRAFGSRPLCRASSAQSILQQNTASKAPRSRQPPE